MKDYVRDYQPPAHIVHCVPRHPPWILIRVSNRDLLPQVQAAPEAGGHGEKERQHIVSPTSWPPASGAAWT